MEYNDEENKMIETAKFLKTKPCKDFRKRLWVFACGRLSLLMGVIFLFRNNNRFLFLFLIVVLILNFFRGVNNNMSQRKLYDFIYKLTGI